VIAGDDGSVWDAASGKFIAMLAATGGRASHLAFTLDGRYLIWQTADGVIEVWGVEQ